MNLLNLFTKRYQRTPVQEVPNVVVDSMPDPVVSCWMVAYNQVKYIQKALDSVMMQQCDFPVEIILGDDGSTDGTREICIDYANRYPDRIRLFLHHRDNQIRIKGDTPNPNFQGVYNWLHCRGRYIATLEADDYWTDPFKLQTQVEFLERNTRHSGVFTNFMVVDEHDHIVRDRKYERQEVDPTDFHLDYISSFKIISRTLTCMYRRNEEVSTELIDLAEAPYLDRVLIVLNTARGPMRYLDANMAAFRTGSGYFTPQRKAVGMSQLMDQWERLAVHFARTEFERIASTELHRVSREYYDQCGWVKKTAFWFRLYPVRRRYLYNPYEARLFRALAQRKPYDIPRSIQHPEFP